MRVLVTGAAGYVGSALVRVMRQTGQVAGQVISALALADQTLENEALADTHDVTSITGDLADPATLRRVQIFAPDVVFHLAAVPGGAAEADPALGRRVNLDATLALLDAVQSPGRRPMVVYASSVAAYGSALPDPVTDATPLRPALTYGAHKLVCEVLLADATRRGQLDARSLRLPGIVARPGHGVGLKSAFMSDVLHALKKGEDFVCPVGPEATAWWMSATRCAENLLHAAAMKPPHAHLSRAWPLPVLRLSMREVVDACASLYGDDRRSLVSYQPDPALEAVFGRYPRLDDAASRALGLRCDGSATDLVRRALGETQ